jgi:hypothetical protein
MNCALRGTKLSDVPFSDSDREALAAAVRRLENPSLAGRLAVLAGKPVGLVQRALPATVSAAVSGLAKQALERALEVALFSLRKPTIRGGRVLHSSLACTSGAIGGAFGLAALAIELPVSTTIMLRAIAAIAQQEGEDLADPRTGLACLEVFALGGVTDQTGVEADYFAVRAMLTRALLGIADFAIDKGAIGESAPFLARFVTQVAARFGVLMSEKVAAQTAAVIGAAGGAAVNLAFIEHFQDIALGHFTVRRLERVYGAETVRGEYDRLKFEPVASA